MECGEIPSPNDDSIVLAFAGAFTGTEFDKGHANVAGDHVAGGSGSKAFAVSAIPAHLHGLLNPAHDSSTKIIPLPSIEPQKKEAWGSHRK